MSNLFEIFSQDISLIWKVYCRLSQFSVWYFLNLSRVISYYNDYTKSMNNVLVVKKLLLFLPFMIMLKHKKGGRVVKD